MVEINLLQPEKKSQFEAHAPAGSGNFLLWGLVALMVLELGGFGALYSFRKKADSKAAVEQAKIVEIDKKIASFSNELNRVTTDQGVLSTFSELLDKHIHWSNVWKALGEYTLKSVQYLNLETSAVQNTFVVSGRVSNFTEVGKLLLGLQSSENFTAVELLSTKAGDVASEGVEFQVSVTVKSDLLVPSISEK